MNWWYVCHCWLVTTFIINIVPVFGFLLQGALQHEIEHLCLQIKQVNCQVMYLTQDYEVTCGTDGVTYPDFCLYAQARCRDNSLSIQNIGVCNMNATNVSPPSHQVVTTESPINGQQTTSLPLSLVTVNVIVQVFCSNADHHNCTKELDPVCGSDGKFYYNDCEFAKALCKDGTLMKQDLDICKMVSITTIVPTKLPDIDRNQTSPTMQ